jgi:putative transcriptional regulator
MFLQPAAGRLLVASALLTDPNFNRTVVFLLDHDSGGTLGVVLNRPGELTVADTLPPWSDLAGDPGLIFRGGPVGRDAALALGALTRVPVDPGAEPLGWRKVAGHIGLVDLDAVPEFLRPAVDHLRVFAGHAGWAPGQLDSEIAAGAWLVVDAAPTDVFSVAPERLWSTVARRLPGTSAFLSTMPEDPNLN